MLQKMLKIKHSKETKYKNKEQKIDKTFTHASETWTLT